YYLDTRFRDILVTDQDVLAQFNPVLPQSFKRAAYVLLGKQSPDVPMRVIYQYQQRTELVILHTSNCSMDIALDGLMQVLKKIDVLVINDSEERQLSGEHSLAKAAKIILNMGPQYLVIKKGEHGALLFHENKVFSAPALPLDDVFDPTG